MLKRFCQWSENHSLSHERYKSSIKYSIKEFRMTLTMLIMKMLSSRSYYPPHTLIFSFSLFCLYLFGEFTLNFMSISMWSFHINNGIISHTWTMKYQMSWQNSIRFTKEFSTSVTMKIKNRRRKKNNHVPCANCWLVCLQTHRNPSSWSILYILYMICHRRLDCVCIYGKRTLFKN